MDLTHAALSKHTCKEWLLQTKLNVPPRQKSPAHSEITRIATCSIKSSSCSCHLSPFACSLRANFAEVRRKKAIPNMSQLSLATESWYGIKIIITIINMSTALRFPIIAKQRGLRLHANAVGVASGWSVSRVIMMEKVRQRDRTERQPALIHNTYIMIFMKSNRNAGCCHAGFYYTSISGLQGTWRKWTLIKGSSFCLFPLRSHFSGSSF